MFDSNKIEAVSFVGHELQNHIAYCNMRDNLHYLFHNNFSFLLILNSEMKMAY